MTKKTCSSFWIEYFPRKVIKSKLQFIDAYEALECFDQTDIAVALLDIRMHPIDGIALLVEIKKRCPSTHVIMISSCLTTENESRLHSIRRNRLSSKTFGDSETEDRASWSARRVKLHDGSQLTAAVAAEVKFKS